MWGMKCARLMKKIYSLVVITLFGKEEYNQINPVYFRIFLRIKLMSMNHSGIIKVFRRGASHTCIALIFVPPGVRPLEARGKSLAF